MPRCYAKSSTGQGQPIQSHQLCWGDWEMRTATSRTKYSQLADLILATGRHA